MNDVFYETPRLPMFFCMEEMNVVRVRAIRYTNGVMDGILADWGVDNIQTEFYPPKHWNDEYERPFYCLFKENGEWSHYGYGTVRRWAEAMLKEEWCDYDSVEEIIANYVDQARLLGCPMFDSKEEAYAYVFQNRNLK